MSEKDSNPKDAIGDTKTPLGLLSPVAKAAWAIAQYAGLIKYGAWNWRVAGVRGSVYVSAISRHLDAYVSGEDYDPTDGSHHLGNIMACCAILLDARSAGKLTDDRPPSVDIRGPYAEAEDQVAFLKEKYKDRSPRHYTIEDTWGESDEPVPYVPSEVRSEAFSVAEGTDYSDDYCVICDHDFCQCPHTVAERPVPERVNGRPVEIWDRVRKPDWDSCWTVRNPKEPWAANGFVHEDGTPILDRP